MVRMTKSQLKCVLDCIASNGGSDGDNQAVDEAVRKARVQPDQLAKEDIELLLNVQLSYFYASNSNMFNEHRDHLWDCVKGCIDGSSDSPPDWFLSTATLLQVLI